ncbi:MAG: hypothetical protein QE271_04785 [Bacteriovoracaceae bacterium]|nr:hypothetical protein [Bacteriovoracaceae bacterium]
MKTLFVLFFALNSYHSSASENCKYDWSIFSDHYTTNEVSTKTVKFFEKLLKKKGYERGEWVNSVDYRFQFRTNVPSLENSKNYEQVDLTLVVRKLTNTTSSLGKVVYKKNVKQKISNLPFSWGLNLAIRKSIKKSLKELPNCK